LYVLVFNEFTTNNVEYVDYDYLNGGKRMKAYVTQQKGLDSIVPADLPSPTLNPNQVLLKMKAASLNYRDLLVAKGYWTKHWVTIPLEVIPLSDGMGEVVEVGQQVTRFKKGDRVASTFFRGWISGHPTDSTMKTDLGGSIPGILAEYVAFDEDSVVKVPDRLTDEEAATLPCAALTAWNALFASGTLRTGQTVLVQGTGGVSVFALQFARAAGARVLAISSSDRKLHKLKELGADAVVNYQTTPDWDSWAINQTGGKGVDLVVEVGGAGTISKSLSAVRVGGEVSLVGLLTGSAGDVPLPNFLQKQVRVQSIYVGNRETFETMNGAISFHQLQPVVDRVFPFEQAVEAYYHLESGQHFGKVVIRF
jgi:NADPH:quinone reductase-like Zn-dependent oxidoreductase